VSGRLRPIRAVARLALLAALAATAGGCVLGAQLGATAPTAVTQQLVIRSLERAVANIDVERFEGKRAALEVYTQIATQPIVRAYVASSLEARGVRIVDQTPEVTLRVFVSALGTDRGETFLGIPAFQAPVVNLGIPEIALFKWVRNRGLTELTVFAFDGATGTFVDKQQPELGRSKQDDFVVLIVIGFTVSDLQKRSTSP
jgi:hypothetical protein